jgi:hypothetical protein
MKTFDFEQVTAVIAPLKAKFEDCAHGEGNSCETLDKHLECCAKIVSEFTSMLRSWVQDVFSGELIFDPKTEMVWRSEAQTLLSRASRVWQMGRKAEVPCYELPAQAMLSSALWELNWFVEKWVTPKLSVSPSARVKLKLDAENRKAVADQLSSLPPLKR